MLEIQSSDQRRCLDKYAVPCVHCTVREQLTLEVLYWSNLAQPPLKALYLDRQQQNVDALPPVWELRSLGHAGYLS